MNGILQPDLFGGDTPISISNGRESLKSKIGYHLATDNKNCSNCKKSYQHEFHNKRYRKCIRLGYSHGPATDVSRKMVCKNWEAK